MDERTAISRMVFCISLVMLAVVLSLSGCPANPSGDVSHDGSQERGPATTSMGSVEMIDSSKSTLRGTVVDRFRVPGGWIYRTMLSDSSGVAVAQTFVPELGGVRQAEVVP